MKTVTQNLIVAISGLILLSLAMSASAQRLNKLIELFENDQPAFGVLSFDYSLNNARAMASSGLDFLFIDMEHAPFDIERLRLFLLGMTDKRSICLLYTSPSPRDGLLSRMPSSA